VLAYVSLWSAHTPKFVETGISYESAKQQATVIDESQGFYITLLLSKTFKAFYSIHIYTHVKNATCSP